MSLQIHFIPNQISTLNEETKSLLLAKYYKQHIVQINL